MIFLAKVKNAHDKLNELLGKGLPRIL